MLTKEEVIEIFFKERQLKEEILSQADIHNKYLSRVPLQPANLERIETIVSKQSEIVDNQSQIEKTLSLCSAFSRVTIDKNIYIDIIKNRKAHNIFLDLAEKGENIDEKQWHYMDDKDNIFGPFSTQQMNDFFKLFKLNEKFKVKKKFDSDDFIPFKVLIKRYYKKMLAEKLDIEKTRSRALSKKTVEFRKGDLVKTKKNQIEKFSSQGRVTRVLSEEVKPNLYFLGDIEEEESDSEEEEDYKPKTRIRSLTSASKH